jgi:ABC-type uncharacterized transport system substrate-binding protein
MKLRGFDLFVVAVAAFAGSPAAAHPHVFVDARADIVFDDRGRMTEISHSWQFDQAFSEFAVQGLDENDDGKLDSKELKPLAEINVTSLKEFEFFSYLTIGTDRAILLPPEKYWLEFENGRLTLFFTLPLEEPRVVAAHAMLEVFDREYFVEFGFPKDQPVRLKGAPAGCGMRHHAPEELDARTMAILGGIPQDQRELPPDLVQAVSSLANYVAVTCK